MHETATATVVPLRARHVLRHDFRSVAHVLPRCRVIHPAKTRVRRLFLGDDTNEPGVVRRAPAFLKTSGR